MWGRSHAPRCQALSLKIAKRPHTSKAREGMGEGLVNTRENYPKSMLRHVAIKYSGFVSCLHIPDFACRRYLKSSRSYIQIQCMRHYKSELKHEDQ